MKHINIIALLAVAVIGLFGGLSAQALDTTNLPSLHFSKALDYEGVITAIDVNNCRLTISTTPSVGVTKDIVVLLQANTQIKRDGIQATITQLAIGDKVGGRYNYHTLASNIATSVIATTNPKPFTVPIAR